jgi:hypothetical protein
MDREVTFSGALACGSSRESGTTNQTKGQHETLDRPLSGLAAVDMQQNRKVSREQADRSKGGGTRICTGPRIRASALPRVVRLEPYSLHSFHARGPGLCPCATPTAWLHLQIGCDVRDASVPSTSATVLRALPLRLVMTQAGADYLSVERIVDRSLQPGLLDAVASSFSDT